MGKSGAKKYLQQYESGDPCLSWVEPECLSAPQYEELCVQIGRVLFLFNSVESSLDYHIADMISDRSRIPGYVITSELNSFAKKVAVFKTLIGLMSDSLPKKTITLHASLVKKLFQLKDVRNDVAHANWMSANADYEVRLRLGTDEKGVYAITKQLSPDYLETKIEEMEKVLEAMELLSMQLSEK